MSSETAAGREGEMARIDREWESERERYVLKSRLGGRYAPSLAAAVLMAVCVVGLGAFWFAMAAISDRGSGLAPLFDLFGAATVVVGLAISLRQYVQATRYRTAYRAYLRRRERGGSVG